MSAPTAWNVQPLLSCPSSIHQSSTLLTHIIFIGLKTFQKLDKSYTCCVKYTLKMHTFCLIISTIFFRSRLLVCSGHINSNSLCFLVDLEIYITQTTLGKPSILANGIRYQLFKETMAATVWQCSWMANKLEQCPAGLMLPKGTGRPRLYKAKHNHVLPK